MEFLKSYPLVVVGLLAVYGTVRAIHLIGQAYWEYRLVHNARGHENWLHVKRVIR